MKVFLTVFLLALTGFSKEKGMSFKSLADLDQCEKNYSWDTSPCIEPLRAYLKTHPNETFEAAKKARRVFASWVSVEWFDAAIAKDKKVCADPEFHTAILNAFVQSPDNKMFEKSKKLFAGACQKDLMPIVLKNLDDNAGSYMPDAVCPTIKSAGKSHKACEPQKEQVAAVKEEKLPVLDKAKMKMDAEVKVFRGPEGATFSMVKLKEQTDLFLVKFDGVNSPWKGKVLLHKEAGANPSTGTADYWTENEGSRWNTITKRNCYQGYCNYLVFLPGQKGELSFSYDENESKAASKKASEIFKNF